MPGLIMRFSSLSDAAEASGLKSFERVKAIYVEPEQFTVDNGLLTPTLKLKRPQARKHYAKQIEDMYAV
jgi:long-chain acyl-CoA synthetase